MYVILTYDVDASRCVKVCNYLRTSMHRVQNSVFEGELTESQLARIRTGLLKIIDADSDSVILWVMRDSKWTDRQIIGPERFPIDQFV